ncbi:glycerophosphodiester phosphodiesterase family protein [Bacillus sp. JCM 19034]|uniref:glycerophosphodiester phosphodiesterase n=1 Tax=Bacillus sp. JCM 19034 TaxID=1481928 RepID=UPI000781C9A5|nr:glycerophosphodiester phosphodiesterase family protein [Bacillus sp. JCM 19034]
MVRSIKCTIVALLIVLSFEQSQAASHVSFFAHRGASTFAPENTIEAFQQALEHGTDYIELDVQLTKDEQLVVIHDETVDRTTNGVGNVNDYTLAELKELDAGSWFNERYANEKIPALKEIFELFGSQVHYCIEIKGDAHSLDTVTNLHQMIKDYQLSDYVMIQSFDENILRLFHNQRVQYPLIQIISRPKNGVGSKKQLDQILEYADGVCLNGRYTTNSFVKQARKRGLMVHIYTLNEKQEIERWMNAGATGIITDNPRLMSYFK